MELSGTQCEVAANLIPVLLLAFTLQSRSDGRHLYGPMKAINSFALLALVAAWGVAFSGVDNGLGLLAGTFVFYAALGGVTTCASTMIALYIVPPSDRSRDRRD